MGISRQEPSKKHMAFRDDVITILRKHGEHMSAQEMLALASNIVGQLIALQDQRTTSRSMALDIVTANIEQGNKDAVDNLLNIGGSKH